MNTQPKRYDDASGQELYRPKKGEKMVIAGNAPRVTPLSVTHDYVRKLERQRDELLAALREIAALERWSGNAKHLTAINLARTAIAKTEKRKQ